VNEVDVWQIIQSGNEISVMRVEVYITITVGVLVISSLKAIRLNLPLLAALLVTYFVYGYANFNMLVGEMHILLAGMSQLEQMIDQGENVSLMGHWLASQLDTPVAQVLIPVMHVTYWGATVSTIAYSIWRYRTQENSNYA
jgi:hypothetical protein